MQTKTINRQGGFAVVELALIVIVLVALAGVGFFVYQRVHKSSDQSGTASSSQQVLSDAGQAAQNAAKASQSQAAKEATSGTNEANSAISQDSGVDNQASQAGGSDGTNL